MAYKHLLSKTILCGCLFLVGTLSAQKYSNEFLTLGVGARAQAMSNAVVASVSDGTAGYWNPAGMTHLSNFQLNAMHAEWFAGVAKYDYLSFVQPLKGGTAAFGISAIRLAVDDIPYTFTLVEPDGSINYDNVSPFSSADYGILVSYAKRVEKWKTRLGGNVKIINRSVGRFANAWGFGLDLGLQHSLIDNQRSALILGFTAKDVTTTFNAWKFNFTDEEKVIFETSGNVIPQSSVEITNPRFTLALAHILKFSNETKLTSEIDADFTTDGQRNVLVSSKSINIDPRVGFELGYRNYLFLRAGVGNFQQYKDETDANKLVWTMQPNVGVGFKLNRLKIDYAFTNIGNVSQVLYSHVFSASLDFEAKGKKQRKEEQEDDFFKKSKREDDNADGKKKSSKRAQEDDFFKDEKKPADKKPSTKPSDDPKKYPKANNRPKVIEQID